MSKGWLYDFWVVNTSGTNAVRRYSEGVNDLSLSPGSIGATACCVDRQNVVWIVGADSVIMSVKDETWQTPIPIPLYKTKICVGRDGSVWASRTTGVSQLFNGKNVKNFTFANSGTNIWSICCDKKNKIWLSDYGSGKLFSIANGVLDETGITISSGHVEGICCDLNNVIWVTDYTNGTITPVIDGVAQAPITVGTNPNGICVDRDNNKWVSNYGSYTLQKIVDGVAQTAISTVGRYALLGDATGMQAAMLFDWIGDIQKPQAQIGGM